MFGQFLSSLRLNKQNSHFEQFKNKKIKLFFLIFDYFLQIYFIYLFIFYLLINLVY